MILDDNARTPDTSGSDLTAVIGGCHAAEQQRIEICELFGRETFRAARDARLERMRCEMAHIIGRYIARSR